MEMLLCAVIIGFAIWGIAALIESNSRIDPERLGNDLASALTRGDNAKAEQLIDKISGWKITDGLKDVAAATCDLRRHSALASKAGVPADRLQPLGSAIARNEEIVVVVTRKVAALRDQSGGKWRNLPALARNLVETDAARLNDIVRASKTVNKSLVVATAAVQASDTRGRADSLEAFGRALRELTES